MGGIFMKDVYEHLNDIDMDVSQFEVGTVSEEEKDRLKMELKRKIRKPKPIKWRKMAAIASISIGLSSAALFGLSFTTFAQEIPIIGNVFKYFNNDGFYEKYGENANALAMIQEENDIHITMNEAVFDGKTLYMTYTIDSKTDLGESPDLIGMPSIDDDPSALFGHAHELLKSGENKYVGMTSAHLVDEVDFDKGTFEFIIESIIPDPALGAATVNGHWDFQFELSTTENVEQKIDQLSEQNGVTVMVKKAIYTPMSFLLFYDELITEEVKEKWDFVLVDIVVKDDLGNLYTSEHNGGYSDVSTLLQHSNTFNKLDSEATNLIITPIVRFLEADGTEENGSIYRNEDSTAAKEEFQLEDIIFEINK